MALQNAFDIFELHNLIDDQDQQRKEHEYEVSSLLWHCDKKIYNHAKSLTHYIYFKEKNDGDTKLAREKTLYSHYK